MQFTYSLIVGGRESGLRLSRGHGLPCALDLLGARTGFELLQTSLGRLESCLGARYPCRAGTPLLRERGRRTGRLRLRGLQGCLALAERGELLGCGQPGQRLADLHPISLLHQDLFHSPHELGCDRSLEALHHSGR